ncbi:MAG TPA: hypothetical protein VFA26_16370 [Gemmataceae bacterium]|nr:hypothetical protein [Gemmataceae bacterium]
MTPALRRLAGPAARFRLLAFLAGLALVGSALLTAGRLGEASVPAGSRAQAPADEAPPAGNVVRQGFPAAAADPNNLAQSDTAWEVEWDLTHPENRPLSPPGSVLRIRSAKFMWKDRAGKPQWVTVARMLELAEIYVPYDNGWTAFLDVHHHPFFTTPARKEHLGPSCVLPGEILRSANPAFSEKVHKEVHDDGIRWMSAETDSRYQIADRVRRGEKLILWATYFGANYRYVVEYVFTDDGRINPRLGFTGRNFFPRQPDQKDTHLHVGCWRMDFDLGGPKDNDVLLVRRVFDEAAERFQQLARPFGRNSLGQACEGSARWVASEFTTVRVQSRSRKNAHGRPLAYDVIPYRQGTLGQLPASGGAGASHMDFVNQDFWVTRAEPRFTAYVEVPQYASGKRSLEGHPVTVWHSAPALHFPRGEDFGPENGTVNYTGLALTAWAEFFVKPRDLFDSTPLYQPTRRSGRE